MAMTQEQYDEYTKEAQRLGVPVNPNVVVGNPVQAPVQAPQPSTVPPAVAPPQAAAPEQGFMESFKKDYANIQDTMNTVDNSLSQTLIEVLPDVGEMTGAMGGMYYGARTGSVAGLQGAIGGGFVGAMLGSGTGESLKQMFRKEFDPLKVIKTSLESGMWEAGFGALGPLMNFAGSGIEKLRKDKNLNFEEIASLDELLKALEKEGITLTPSQLTGSNFQKTLEKIGKAGFGGEGQFEQLYKAQEQFIRDRMDLLKKQVGNPDRKQSGEAFQQALMDADDQLIEWAQPKFKELNKAARGVKVSLQSTLQSLRHKKALASKGRREGATGRIDSEVEDLYNFVLGDVQNTNFENLFSTIAQVTKDQRKAKLRTDKNPTLDKAYVDVLDLLFKDAEKAAKNSGTDVYNKYLDLQKVYRETKQSLNDRAIASAVEGSPEFAGSEIFKLGSVTSVESAFKALDTAAATAKRAGKTFDAEKAKDDLRAGYLDELFTSAEISETSTEAAMKLLKKVTSDPKVRDTFNAVLTSKQQSEVKKLLGWGAQLEKNSAGNFSLIVRGRQSGELNRLGGIQGNDATGVGLVMVAKALATITAPFGLAKRAVSGGATREYMEQLKDLTVKFDGGDIDAADAATLFGLWATTVTQEEDIPVEFRVKGMNSKEAIEYHANRADIIATYEKAGVPVPQALLEAKNKRPNAE